MFNTKIIFVAGLFALAILLNAKSTPSAFSIGLSPTLQQCPSGVKGYATYCPVGTSTTGYQTYVSYDGQPYIVLP